MDEPFAIVVVVGCTLWLVVSVLREGFAVKWIIKETRTGEYEVWRDRRRLLVTDSEGFAESYIKERMSPGDQMYREEVDGYRTPLRGKRRHWRAAR